jgi:AMIN domain-containing protein
MDSTLADRVKRLERENVRLKRVGAVALLGLAALFVAGQLQRPAGAAGPTRIEAERFLLRDAVGAIRAALETGSDGTPRLALLDTAGHERLRLQVGAGGAPGLTLFDADGKTARVTLKIGAEGTPGLSLSDGSGRARAILALYRAMPEVKDRSSGPANTTPAGPESPALGLYDAAGQPRTFVSSRSQGVSGIHLSDAAGRLRATLAVGADGVPDLELSDEHHKARAALTVLSEGTPLLNLYDTAGRARATLAVIVNGAAGLGLADGKGNPTWTSVKESRDAAPAPVAPGQPATAPDGSKEDKPSTSPPAGPSSGTVAPDASSTAKPPAFEVPRAEPSRPEVNDRPSASDTAEPQPRDSPGQTADAAPTKTPMIATPAPSRESAAASRPTAAAIARVGRAEVLEAGDDTRVRIPGDRPLTYRAYTLDDPPRLVLDLDNASHDPVPRVIDGKGPVLARIRSAQFQVTPTRSVRVVFDLRRAAPFWVEPDGDALVVHLGIDKPAAR